MSSGGKPPGTGLDAEFLRLAEALPQVVWTARADGIIDYVSRDFYVHTGLEPVDLNDLAWVKSLHPDDRERFAERWQASVSSGADYHIEFRVWSPSARDYRWHSVSGKALRDAHGAVERWCGTAIDIHDRRLAEAALSEREQRLRAIIDAQPEGVKIISPDGILVDINPVGLSLIEADGRDALVGKRFDPILHPADRATYWAMHDRVLAGARERLKFRIVGQRGTLRWMDSMTSPLVRTDGGVDGVLCVTRDITVDHRTAQLHAAELHMLDMISAAAPLREIFDYITHFVDELLPDAMSSIVLLDDDRRIRIQSAPRVPAAYNRAVEGLVVDGELGSCGAAIQRGETVVTSDIGTDPRWHGLRETADQCGLRSAWSTPVFDAARAVAGTFAVYHPMKRTPTEHEIELVERVAYFVTVALERTRQASQLRASEQRYRSIYQGVPVSIWEHDWSPVAAAFAELDLPDDVDKAAYLYARPDFVTHLRCAIRLLDVNDMTLRMFEADSREELFARRQEVFARVHPTAFVETLCAYLDGAPGYTSERSLLTLRGKPVHVLMRIAFPPRDRDEQLVLVSLIDISARRVAEQALADSERNFREIAETVGEVFWSASPGVETFNYISPAYERVWGLRAADLYREPRQWYEAILPEDRAAWDAALQNFRPEGQTVEYRIRRSDGAIRWIADSFVGVPDAHGQITRVVGVAKDITEQRQLEAQLRQSQRLDAVGQLTGGIAHDFNNLLTVIVGNTEALSTALAGNPDLGSLADMSHTAALRGAALVNHLLAFARRQALTPQATSVDALIAALEPLLRRALGTHIEIAIRPSTALRPALIDGAQLESAILNLSLNARDAMPDGGTLTITTANVTVDIAHPAAGAGVSVGNYVEVAISDTGTGMDDATRSRAFEPFFTTKAPGSGSGLGLSMVYGFANQSGGGIRIESRPNRGTTVYLYLPCAEPVALEAPSTVASAASPRAGHERILLVEDDPLVRKHVTMQLTQLGYQVHAVADGAAALETLADDADFELLFTDMIMPGGMNGRQIAAAVRARYPAIAILFTSGYTSDAFADEQPDSSLRLLQKPYRRQELASAIRDALDDHAR